MDKKTNFRDNFALILSIIALIVSIFVYIISLRWNQKNDVAVKVPHHFLYYNI